MTMNEEHAAMGIAGGDNVIQAVLKVAPGELGPEKVA
jgi:hypothetical protein